jgi:hypothetical protein
MLETFGTCVTSFSRFKNVNALRSELTWDALPLDYATADADARSFYEAEVVSSRWSTRELE